MVKSVLLIRDARSYGAAPCIERALQLKCVVKTVYINQYPYVDRLRIAPRGITGPVMRKILRDIVSFDKMFGGFDLVLLLEAGFLGFVPKEFATRTAIYLGDPHRPGNLERYLTWWQAPEYDFVFTPQKDYLGRFEDCNVHWLPWGFDDGIFRKGPRAPSADIVFIGNPWPGTPRGDLVERMRREVGMEIHSGAPLVACNELLNQARISFNRSLGGDVNQRVFESLGSGTFLLTDAVGNGLADLFESGRHLATYTSAEEAVRLARQYLEDVASRERIAQSGYEEAHARHTYGHRIDALLGVVA